MLGLDISEHNGYIDFSKMKREKPEIEFFILRLGWIGNKNNHTLDRYFEDFYKNAKANGYKLGVYIIFNEDSDIEDILEFFNAKTA